jgi:ATP-dependent Lon protease
LAERLLRSTGTGFFNKVYAVLESTSKSIEEIEVDKYLNQDYKISERIFLQTANSLRLPLFR